MSDFLHSVSLDAEKCIGCTSCLRHCPTEAIRNPERPRSNPHELLH